MTLTHTYFARVPRRDFPQLLRQGGVPLEAYQDSVKRKLSERHRANPKRRQMLEGIVQRDPAELNREIEDRERELYAQQTGTDIHVPEPNITANMLAGAVQTENAETGRVQNTGTGFLREMRETLLTALQDGINFTYEEMIDIANEAYDEASKLGEITAKQDRQSRPTRAGWISDTTREMQRKRQVLLQAKTRQGIPYDRVFLRDLTTNINEQCENCVNKPYLNRTGARGRSGRRSSSTTGSRSGSTAATCLTSACTTPRTRPQPRPACSGPQWPGS